MVRHWLSTIGTSHALHEFPPTGRRVPRFFSLHTSKSTASTIDAAPPSSVPIWGDGSVSRICLDAMQVRELSLATLSASAMPRGLPARKLMLKMRRQAARLSSIRVCVPYIQIAFPTCASETCRWLVGRTCASNNDADKTTYVALARPANGAVSGSSFATGYSARIASLMLCDSLSLHVIKSQV